MAFGVCTNCRFPPSTGQKWKIFAKHFFDIVTTYNNEIYYVKHVLAPFYVFFTLFGCGGGGGGGGLPRGLGHSFPASAAQNGNFLKLIFLIL